MTRPQDWVWLCLVILVRLGSAQEHFWRTDGAVADLERLLSDCMPLEETGNRTGFLLVPVWRFMEGDHLGNWVQCVKMPAGGLKSDMERVGVFQEMSYISVGDKYAPASKPFHELAYRSRQMQAGVASQRCALQSGFFDKTFKRIFEREALSDPLKLARQNLLQQARKNLGKPFLPCNGVKRACGSGSYYGTLSGPIQALSPQSVSRKAEPSPRRNIVTSPPKKGSGYSYPNVTLSKVELYTSDPYDRAEEAQKREAAAHRSKLQDGPFKLNLHPKEYFQKNPYRSEKPLPPSQKPPAHQTQRRISIPFKPSSPSKRIGGMKAGTFDSYPSHSNDPYAARRAPQAHPEPVFHPPPGPKSMPIKSIITVNVNRSVHSAALPRVMTH